ncbi:MAG: ABC transporter ATP-binding protein [Bifidobacteriaceae bacterium]|jgi:putative ABC transport system ATP-binding protein|nr:ABC transporter ATP-binding protein [Bifidobacteriaceae bacterium]
MTAATKAAAGAPAQAASREASGAAEPVPVIDMRDIWRVYGSGESEVRALAGLDLRVDRGEFVAIIGASGSGKSTAMNILGCLDVADRGTYVLDGTDVSRLSYRELALVRNRKIGFVFQSFNLISRINALRNVELPMTYAGVERHERRRRALAALEMVGLGRRYTHKPGQLSGGQQQRVAVARSLVNAPSLILADEPTGNLDSVSASDVLDVFEQIHTTGRTIVLITHDQKVAARAQRVVTISDGRIIDDTRWGEAERRANREAAAKAGVSLSDGGTSPERPAAGSGTVPGHGIDQMAPGFDAAPDYEAPKRRRARDKAKAQAADTGDGDNGGAPTETIPAVSK